MCPTRLASTSSPAPTTLFMTGVTLINKTAPRLLDLAANATTVFVGPSVVMAPFLFRWGVDMLAGSVVADPDKARFAVKNGAGQFFGQRRCTMAGPDGNPGGDQRVLFLSHGRGANREDALAGIAGGGAGRLRGALRRRAGCRVSGCPRTRAARRCERLREAGHRQRASARAASASLSPVGVTWPEPTAPSTKRAGRRRRSWPGTSTTRLSTRVNAHFDEITAHASAAAPVGAKPHSERSAEGAESKDPSRAPGLLIVDELGRLEIWRGGGLTSAMALLAQGPTPSSPMRWPSCAIICSTTPRPSLPKRGLTAAAFLPMIQVEPLSCPPVSLGRKGQRLDKTGFGRDGYWAARF